MSESTVQTVRIAMSIFFGLITTWLGATRYEAEYPTVSTWELVGLWTFGWPLAAVGTYFMMKTWMDWRNRR